MIEIVQFGNQWMVAANGALHGPFNTLRAAEICAERLKGKCKDCGA